MEHSAYSIQVATRQEVAMFTTGTPLRPDPGGPSSPETRMEEIHAQLEKHYIETYLRDKGYTLTELNRLPGEVAERLMAEASRYASLRLAESEMKSRLVHELEGVGEHRFD
jgi:hypothetical protein